MTTTLAFAVRRKDPVLLGPVAATPHETKRLSDIDDQEGLRRHPPNVFLYRGGDDRGDPVAVIRRALGKALVPYYPIAGRLREVDGGRLVVDCTGEGVLFVEADADVRLAELEAAGLRPPFPCMDQLLFDVEGSSDVLNCPLLLIQVTRLLCGGFVFALRLNHVICDATGIAQFISDVAELARGLPSPTVSPSWSRDLLRARSPPKPPTFPHHECNAVSLPTQASPPSPSSGDVMRTFTFGPPDISAIKMRLPPRLRDTATTFEVLTAALWRARTAALELPPDEHVRLMVVYNVRGDRELGLPAGYYGNACVFPKALTTAGELLALPLGHAVDLVRNAKAAVTAEFVRSVLDFLVLRGRPSLAESRGTFLVSEIRHAGFHRVDFGWGQPVYGSRANAKPGLSFVLAVKNGFGEDAVAFPIVLLRLVMDRFASEVEMLLAPMHQASLPAPRARL